MSFRSFHFFGLFALLLLLTAGCSDDDMPQPEPEPEPEPTFMTYSFSPENFSADSLQAVLITMENSDVIELAAGTYDFTQQLSVIDKDSIKIIGAGRSETVLSFAEQAEGAQGLKVDNCNQITLANFTVQNSKGDAIKTKDCDGVTFYQVGAVWTGGPSPDNGAYGIYPVKCDNVLIDGCLAQGASDAGLYVGQSNKVIVRNSTATENVAGIEIENTTEADVYNNEAYKNTGGVLVFDLPGLSQYGRQVRVFNNNIYDNDTENFAPSGNIVGAVPPGTGVLILSTTEVEVFDNEISNNNMLGLAIVNYEVFQFLGFGGEITDENYEPVPSAIHVHNNTFERGDTYPDSPHLVSGILQGSFFPDASVTPDIVYDGIVGNTVLEGTQRICIGANNGAGFANVHLDKFPGEVLITTDMAEHDCSHEPLPTVEVNAPSIDGL